MPPIPVGLDLEALLQLVDGRADEIALAAESEWTERHLAAARRALRSDFDPRSLAVFECLLSGERVGDVAARFRMNDQAVYKIKQRVSKRLTEIVQRSIAIEESRARPSEDSVRGDDATAGPRNGSGAAERGSS